MIFGVIFIVNIYIFIMHLSTIGIDAKLTIENVSAVKWRRAVDINIQIPPVPMPVI